MSAFSGLNVKPKPLAVEPEEAAAMLAQAFAAPSAHGEIPAAEFSEATATLASAPARAALDGREVSLRCSLPSEAAALAAVLSEDRDGHGRDVFDARRHAAESVAFDRPAHDRWGVGKVMLVHCDDFMQSVLHFPWWTAPSSKWRPVVLRILAALGVAPERMVRCLLAKLPPGGVIPVHSDTGRWVARTHRVHMPVVTDPDKVIFRAGVDDARLKRWRLEAGDVVELNNQARHAVANLGTADRVHLILDYVDASCDVPPLSVLAVGERLEQTRRSIDRASACGARPCPSFLIIGAQKAGTTTMYESLMSHPLGLRGVRRETHFFDWRWEDHHATDAQRAAAYRRYFNWPELKRCPSLVSGDSTPSYLLSGREVIPRAQALAPNAAIIVMLRDPIERAYSHYQMCVDPRGTPAQLKVRGRAEWAGKTFEQVVDAELKALADKGVTAASTRAEFERGVLDGMPNDHGGHSLLARGMYAHQLRPWLDAYGSEKVLVLKMEDMKSDGGQRRAFDRACSHVGLPPHPEWSCVGAKNTRDYGGMGPAVRAKLEALYRPHDEALGRLLGEGWGTW